LSSFWKSNDEYKYNTQYNIKCIYVYGDEYDGGTARHRTKGNHYGNEQVSLFVVVDHVVTQRLRNLLPSPSPLIPLHLPPSRSNVEFYTHGICTCKRKNLTDPVGTRCCNFTTCVRIKTSYKYTHGGWGGENDFLVATFPSY